MCTRVQLRLLPIGDNTKCRSPKNSKNCGFSPTEGDRINRSRRNLVRKRIPWLCYYAIAHHIWPSSVKGGRYRSPPKMSKFAQSSGFWPPVAETMNTFRCNLARKCRPLAWYSTPNLALIGERGLVQGPQISKICPKLWFLATRSVQNEHIQMKFGL